MQVKELREELKTRGLSTTGNKPELVARLEAALGSGSTANGDFYASPDSDGEKYEPNPITWSVLFPSAGVCVVSPVPSLACAGLRQ